MTTIDTTAESRNEKPPDRKPWHTPHFAALAEMHETNKFAGGETTTLGPS